MYGVLILMYLDSEWQIMNRKISGLEEQRHSGGGKRMNSL